ncbi:helicase-related protein [Rhodoligotrophos ferricapiens]|uniref:helicase-related protein n=1 Tax=Rhodoligotrophos ferricapiens TaxID=3069264 RepID=UPI00315CFE5D
MKHQPAPSRLGLLPEISQRSPLGAIAVSVLTAWQQAGPGGVLFLSADERRTEHLGAMLYALDPECNPLVLPRWDALPYDGGLPAREIMGRRSSVLRRLAEGLPKPLVITTVDAALQRVPYRAIWPDATLRLTSGFAITTEELRSFFLRTGYEVDALVDEPGEVAIQRQMVDVYPAGALGPVRIGLANGEIASLQSYDPTTQRTTDDLPEVVLDAASELAVLNRPQSSSTSEVDEDARSANLETLFDYLPGAVIIRDHDIDRRMTAWLEQVREAYEGHKILPLGNRPVASGIAIPPQDLYLGEAEWHAAFARSEVLDIPKARTEPGESTPKFIAERSPRKALQTFIESQRANARRILLAAIDERDLRRLEQRARQAAGSPIERCPDWHSALASSAEVVSLQVDFDAGFVMPSLGVAVIAASDVLGSRTSHETPLGWRERDLAETEEVLRPGDVVIHLDRGAAVLRGLESVTALDVAEQEVIRLEFANEASVMVPVEELALIWRYGADAEITLDRADGASWVKRRNALQEEIRETAQKLVALASEREAKSAPKLVPPVAEYERFVARFPYFPTPDQARAAEEVLADLARGRPMDRLVCGDVGFGKTEIALRAAAAAILSGKQVAVAVPTTVLARQHYETFRRRFSGFNVKIGQLSRLTPAAEKRAVKKSLRDGTLNLVIGTHALAQKDIRFHDLALVVIDEEQRFGARHKATLRELGQDAHRLTLTATPIPRTLQAAITGLQSVSVIATPPTRRLPVRTLQADLSDETVRSALIYEWRRGGQSFIVCPRIEDLEPWQQRLVQATPELTAFTIHGKMPASDVDDVMMRFAAGEGDVLLATNIIESGLDLPRANTILIWRPDRFGLAQLHQLRGRVGRGGRRGYAYLMRDPQASASPLSEKRLRVLQELNQLGAGFDISARDLDLRGAGDLFGAEQAGHLKLVGPALYRHLLDGALSVARGEPLPDETVPELNIGLSGRIPPKYIADEAVRLELYDRLAKVQLDGDIDTMGEEIADRFGPPPPEIDQLLGLAKLRLACRRFGISRLDVGPQGIAITIADGAQARRHIEKSSIPVRWREGRLIAKVGSTADDRIIVVTKVIERLLG